MTNKILWKIYAIWFLRRIVPLMFLQAIILVLVLKLLARKIFFVKILENATLAANSSYWEFFKYLLGAFFQTHFVIQIFILVVLGIGALLLRDLGRVIVHYLRTFRK